MEGIVLDGQVLNHVLSSGDSGRPVDGGNREVGKIKIRAREGRTKIK